MPELPDSPYGLWFRHNMHKIDHMSLEFWLPTSDILEEEWVSDAEKQKAIEINEIWTLQWYPHNSEASFFLAASTQEALLQGVKDLEDSLRVRH